VVVFDSDLPFNKREIPTKTKMRLERERSILPREKIRIREQLALKGCFFKIKKTANRGPSRFKNDNMPRFKK
jgi:hypothetical protein